MSPPILHSRWYEKKSWIYFYSMESLAGVGVAHQVEISAQQPGPATAPLRPGWAADHWSPVRRGWSSAWPQQPPSPGADPPWWRPVWRRCKAPPAAQPWLPHSAEARSKKKLSLEATYLPQWAPKLTQNRFCGLMNYIQTVGRQCLWSFIIYLLLIVQDIFENYYFNKRELNEPTYFSYDRHGKNSLLLWGEISHAHILNSQSPVSGLQTDLFYCSISFCEQVATVPGCIYFIQFAALLIHDIEEFSYKRTVLWIFYSVFTAGKLMSSMLYS